jgi:phosphate transport system substrate-binding protein
MIDKNNKGVPLNKDVALLIRGLIIGKVLTLLVIGGLFWWLRPRRGIESAAFYTSGQDSLTARANTASTFEKVTDVPTGSFKYGGSTAWAPIRQLVDSQLQNARPELQLRYVNPEEGSPGSSSGIRMLLSGQLDLSNVRLASMQ